MTDKPIVRVTESEPPAHHGRNFTTGEIVTFLLGEFERQEGISLLENYIIIMRMMGVADKAREELSVAESVYVSLPFIMDGKHLDILVTRDALLMKRKK